LQGVNRSRQAIPLGNEQSNNLFGLHNSAQQFAAIMFNFSGDVRLTRSETQLPI